MVYIQAVILLHIGLIQSVVGTVSGPCINHGDCAGLQGLICNFGIFGGCTMGFCTCPSNQAFDSSTGVCKGLVLIGSSCSATDVCSGENSACTSNSCACVNGTASPDNKQCLPTNAEFLGNSCDSAVNICYVYDGTSYVSNGELVECSGSMCRCRSGTTQSGSTCRQKTVGEVGCSIGTCMGGAKCIDDTCVCPSGTKSTKSNTYCASDVANTDVTAGGSCDENNASPTSLCATGYSCQGCPGDVSYKCVSNNGQKTTGKALYLTILCVLWVSNIR